MLQLEATFLQKATMAGKQCLYFFPLKTTTGTPNTTTPPFPRWAQAWIEKSVKGMFSVPPYHFLRTNNWHNAPLWRQPTISVLKSEQKVLTSLAIFSTSWKTLTMLEHIPSFHLKLHPNPIISLTNNERVNLNHSCPLSNNKKQVRRLPLMFKTWPAFVLKSACCPRFILFTVSQQSLERGHLWTLSWHHYPLRTC